MFTNSNHTTIRRFSFSLKRFLGITAAKQQIARETGIPTTKSGQGDIWEEIIQLISNF